MDEGKQEPRPGTDGVQSQSVAGSVSEPEAMEASVTMEDAAEMEAIQAINSRATYLGRCRFILKSDMLFCKLRLSFNQ